MRMRTEWRSVTRVVESGNVSYGSPSSEEDVLRYKAWREPRRGNHNDVWWPEVTITVQRRVITDWQDAPSKVALSPLVLEGQES